MYEEIKNHKAAIELVRADGAAVGGRSARSKKSGKAKKNPITLETLKLLHSALTPEEKAKGNPYRKDNPLHRLYFHEIAQPDKIAMRMKKLVEWLDEEETQHLHPVERAARAHYRLHGDLPVAEELGQGRAPADEPHAAARRLPAGRDPLIERQRYYDVLRTEAAGLVPLVFESLENGVETSTPLLRRARRGQGSSQAQARLAAAAHRRSLALSTRPHRRSQHSHDLRAVHFARHPRCYESACARRFESAPTTRRSSMRRSTSISGCLPLRRRRLQGARAHAGGSRASCRTADADAIARGLDQVRDEWRARRADARPAARGRAHERRARG